jgi:prepilin-type N-terminal cleavage/methylation domain-containing protein
MKKTTRGFSLIEFMLVVLLLLVISGSMFAVITGAMARSGNEQAKLDMFQQAREFMDQMYRDLHQAGYPNSTNFTKGVLANPNSNDRRVAVGIVKIDTGDLWFEADLDGQGTVSVIQYHLDTSTTNGCPCLRRSQQDKIDGNPLTGQTTAVFEVEVQGVQDPNIFSAYVDGATGSPIGLPVDFNMDGPTIATLDTVQAVLTLQSTYVDPQTKQRPITTLVSTVRLNNCSQAYHGLALSCQ